MRKSRDLLKKIRDTKGTFVAKMGIIKDRSNMDLAEDITSPGELSNPGIESRSPTLQEDASLTELCRKAQEYTEEYKKDLHNPDNLMVIWCDHSPRARHPEVEVKWALGSITMNKVSGGDGIPAELFQILEDDAVKVLHSIFQQVWKTQQWP